MIDAITSVVDRLWIAMGVTHLARLCPALGVDMPDSVNGPVGSPVAPEGQGAGDKA